MKSERKKKYDSVLTAVLYALKKGDTANIKALRERMLEFPTIKAKYGPKLDAMESEFNKDMQSTVEKSTAIDLQTPPEQIEKAAETENQGRSPNGNPFDNLYRKQQKSM